MNVCALPEQITLSSSYVYYTINHRFDLRNDSLKSVKFVLDTYPCRFTSANILDKYFFFPFTENVTY